MPSPPSLKLIVFKEKNTDIHTHNDETSRFSNQNNQKWDKN